MEKVTYIMNEKTIQDKLELLCNMKCNFHPKYKAEQVCTSPDCTEKLTCYLCELCTKVHNPYHIVTKQLIPIDIFFSTRLLNKVLEDQQERLNRKMHPEIEKTLDVIDDLFTVCIESTIRSINKHRTIFKERLLQKIQIKSVEDESKIIRDFQDMLTKNFLDKNINDSNEMIRSYVLSFNKLEELRCKQIDLENQLSLTAKNAIYCMEKFSLKLKEQITNLFDNTFEMIMPTLIDPNCWLFLSEKSKIIEHGQNGQITNLMKWIGREELKICKLNLLYRGSRDGFKANKFHEKCDSFSPTISIIFSDLLRVFGGYTKAHWNQDSLIYLNKKDEKAFLFSLTNNEKYMCVNPSMAIYGVNNSLVTYGNGHDITIVSDCDIKDSSSNFPSSYSCSVYPKISEKSKSHLAGSSKFKVLEIEVYHVQWE